MIISRFSTSLDNKVTLYAIREEYPVHSLFYLYLKFPEGINKEKSLTGLSVFLEKNRLSLLMGFAFGYENYHDEPLPFRTSDLIRVRHEEQTFSALQLICTDSKSISYKEYESGAVVRILKHSGLKLLFISNLRPDKMGDYHSMTYSSFNSLGNILKTNGTGYKGLARTWLYIDDILGWYDKLNEARTDFYESENIFTGLIPASTGVGLSNESEYPILINAFAIDHHKGNFNIRMVESPMQCPATDYSSSFSRAVEIVSNNSGRLLVSGTASINDRGMTIHEGNIIKQISHTMKVVESIIVSEQYSWDNVVRAIAYFTRPEDIRFFIDYCLDNNIDSSYILTVCARICRDDLLFEIELDAVKPLHDQDG